MTCTERGGDRDALQLRSAARAVVGGEADVDDDRLVERVREHELLGRVVGGEPLGEVPVGRRRRWCTGRPTCRPAWVERCSTSPPPPSISTIAPTYGACTEAAALTVARWYGGHRQRHLDGLALAGEERDPAVQRLVAGVGDDEVAGRCPPHRWPARRGRTTCSSTPWPVGHRRHPRLGDGGERRRAASGRVAGGHADGDGGGDASRPASGGAARSRRILRRGDRPRLRATAFGGVGRVVVVREQVVDPPAEPGACRRAGRRPVRRRGRSASRRGSRRVRSRAGSTGGWRRRATASHSRPEHDEPRACATPAGRSAAAGAGGRRRRRRWPRRRRRPRRHARRRRRSAPSPASRGVARWHDAGGDVAGGLARLVDAPRNTGVAAGRVDGGQHVDRRSTLDASASGPEQLRGRRDQRSCSRSGCSSAGCASGSGRAGRRGPRPARRAGAAVSDAVDAAPSIDRHDDEADAERGEQAAAAAGAAVASLATTSRSASSAAAVGDRPAVARVGAPSSTTAIATPSPRSSDGNGMSRGSPT